MSTFTESASDSERSVTPTAASAVRQRRRMRAWKRRWSHAASHGPNGGMVLSFSAFRRARRMRHQRQMTKEEYLRLKNMVPSVAAQPRVSKVQVIEEAIKYIDSLHVALFQRLRAQELAVESSRGPSQVTENESGIIQLEASQLGRWISHVLPMPPAVTATRLMAQRQLQQQQCQQQQQQQLQQQSARIKEWPSFATENGHVINKKHS